jgi:hypothetical protein
VVETSFNRFHFVAFALVGWYLMLPPIARDDKRYSDESAPMSQWTQLSAFDSAKECEEYKLKFHEHMEKIDKTRAERELSSACVESDDLRFKQK